MSVVWIVEPPSHERSSTAELLSANFAVRMIGSIASLQRLFRIAGGVGPDVIVIDDRALGSEPIESIRAARLPAGTDPRNRTALGIVVVTDNVQLFEQIGFDAVVLSRNANAFEMKGTIDRMATSDVGLPAGDRAEELSCFGLTLNWKRFALQVSGDECYQALPLKEARLLRVFLENPGKCFSRNDLMHMVWDDIKIGARTIDSHVSRLRKRLSDSPATIESVYGDGYRLATK